MRMGSALQQRLGRSYSLMSQPVGALVALRFHPLGRQDSTISSNGGMALIKVRAGVPRLKIFRSFEIVDRSGKPLKAGNLT